MGKLNLSIFCINISRINLLQNIHITVADIQIPIASAVHFTISLLLTNTNFSQAHLVRKV